MKKFLIHIFISLSLLCPPLISTASDNDNFRPGYVITINRDSLVGFILIRDHSSNSNICVFRKTSDGNGTTYSGDDLMSYGTGNSKYFISHTLEINKIPKRIFLECLVNGKVSLFFFHDKYFLRASGKIEELVIQTKEIIKNEKSYFLKQDVYKGTLQQKLGDCKTIGETIINTTLNEKSLKQLFTKYYDCIGIKPTVFNEEPDKITVSYGVSVAATISQFDPYNAYLSIGYKLSNLNYNQQTAITPSFWVTFKDKKYGIQLRTGLTYYTSNYKGTYGSEAFGQTYEFTIAASRLEIPIHLKYYPLNSNKGIYFLGGAGLNTFLKWDDQFVGKSYPGNITTYNISNSFKGSFFPNYTFGAGYEFTFSKSVFFLEGTYGSGGGVMVVTNNPNANNDLIGKITAYNLTAGITF